MFRKSTGADFKTDEWLDFDLREITGRWVSPQGMPPVRIYRTRKGNIVLELTYNNPQAVYKRSIRNMSGIRYFSLFGRIGLAYDAERDALLLSSYGEYIRAEEPTTC